MLLYERSAGEAWNDLHEAVRRFHRCATSLEARGRFAVRTGKGLIARWLSRLLRLPEAGRGIPTRLVIDRHDDGETWRRTFGDRRLDTELRARKRSVVAERFGAFEILLRVEVSRGVLWFRHTGTRLRCGPMSLPVPRLLAPRIAGRAWGRNGRAEMGVVTVVAFPIAGVVLAYRGYVARTEPAK